MTRAVAIANLTFERTVQDIAMRANPTPFEWETQDQLEQARIMDDVRDALSDALEFGLGYVILNNLQAALERETDDELLEVHEALTGVLERCVEQGSETLAADVRRALSAAERVGHTIREVGTYMQLDWSESPR